MVLLARPVHACETDVRVAIICAVVDVNIEVASAIAATQKTNAALEVLI